MNIVTVAEGVENDNQLVQLRSLGCDIAQGYLFSRAISAERVPAWLRKWSQNLPGWSKRSEEHTSEIQSLMRISYAVFCLKKKNTKLTRTTTQKTITTTP